MKKGIIMEVDDPFLTLLTPDGEFLRARKQDRIYIVGEEIDFFPEMDSISSKYPIVFKNFFKRKSIWMSVAALLVCFASIFPIYQSNKAYAYMSIGADTSIELGLNKKMQVVELKGFNQEAEDIISQIDDWKKKDAAELTTIILAELKDEGLLAPAEPVVISTVKTVQLKEEAVTKLEANISKIKKTADKQVEVNHYTTTKAEVEKAESLGESVGIYHKKKNDTAKSKEKLKSTEKDSKKNITSHPSPSSKLPPGQEKKQDEGNNMERNNNLNKQVHVQNENNEQQGNNGDNRNKENGTGKGNQPVKEATVKNNNKPNNTWDDTESQDKNRPNNHDTNSQEKNRSNNHDTNSQEKNRSANQENKSKHKNQENKSQQKNKSNNQEKQRNK